MFKKSNIVFALSAVLATMLACVNPMDGTTPANVETIVPLVPFAVNLKWGP